MKRVQEEGIDNIIFLDSVGKASIGDLIEYFDCCYMGSMKSPLYRFGISFNKMYDSMMAGKPIICAIDTPECLVDKYECGIVIRNGKPSEIQGAIERLFNMQEYERIEMGRKGKEAVLKYYNYTTLAEQFEKLFKE